ncbi:hypothetical protein Q0M94_25810 (plasmid) [Deinococcus radiomollis]|uniref:hypothetical protein n=1 Tax=Deinococcus radiomollis TaxID=468916 RepID=UPI0038925CFC
MKIALLSVALMTSSSALGATLTDMVNHLGKYLYELKLLDRPAFKQRVTRMLGQSYYTLLIRSTQVQGPLGGTRALVYFSGIEAYNGVDSVAVVVYDMTRDAMNVWLKINGRLLSFEERPFVNTSLFPKDLNDAMQGLYRY